MLLDLPPQKKRMGYVYLIKSDRYYKIGLTRRDPDVRLKEITTPKGTTLIHIIETTDPEGLEQFLHKEFKEKRAEREWFKLDAEDIAWIKQLKW